MRTKAQKAVADAREALASAEVALAEERSRRTILCSCGKRHKIKDLELLQTHWYVEPHGCTGGDYWNEGEVQFICPMGGTRNRVMFDDNHLHWSERGRTALAFAGLYKRLFKSVADVYARDESPFYNNYYVDQHRERFELPVKPKK